MTDTDLHADKARHNSATTENALEAFFAKGVHIDLAGDIVIPSPGPNAKRTRLCKKYGFRFSREFYSQWHRSPRWAYQERTWTPAQWLDLAQKIEEAS